MTAPILVRAADIEPQPWRNGGGTTRELLLRPAATSAWRLRISVAEIASDGPFSVFRGIQRWFAVIEGAGVHLTVDGRDRLLQPGDEPLHFAGEAAVHCRLIDGPTVDLNLMHAGGAASMERARSGVPWRSSLPQRGLFTRAAGVWSAPDAPQRPTLRLPPRCLLWLDQADSAAWTFLPDSSTPLAPALWLGFSP